MASAATTALPNPPPSRPIPTIPRNADPEEYWPPLCRQPPQSARSNAHVIAVNSASRHTDPDPEADSVVPATSRGARPFSHGRSRPWTGTAPWGRRTGYLRPLSPPSGQRNGRISQPREIAGLGLKKSAPALEEERARPEREEEEEANRTREVAATAEAAQSRLIILISRGVTDFGQATDQSQALHLLDGVAQRRCGSATRCLIWAACGGTTPSCSSCTGTRRR